MRGILAALVALPVLALFGGVGILAYQIGQTWDSRATEALIVGFTVTCGSGAVILALVLGLVVGIPYASRIWREGYQQIGQTPHTSSLAVWQQQPPQIEGRDSGQWLSLGPGQYDLWDAENDLLTDGSTEGK